jgi:hypothetical protein
MRSPRRTHVTSSAAASISQFRSSHRKAETDRLRAPIRTYGESTLFYVRLEDDAHPNGTVETTEPGLMVGYMDRFKLSRSDQLSAAPPTASWLAVCRNAYSLWWTA